MSVSHIYIIDTLKGCGFKENNWLKLGRKLRIPRQVLQSINNPLRTPEECLTQCLKEWQGKGPPDWEALSLALRAINDNDVANQLDKLKHPAIKIFNKSHTALAKTHFDAIGVAQLLNEERVIPDDVVNQISAKELVDEQHKVLFDAVRKAIQINYGHLETFASVLMRFTHTVLIGKCIHKACGNAIPQCRGREFRSIRLSFESTFSKIQKILTPLLILERTKLFLENHFPRDLKPQIADIEDIDGFWCLIKEACSLIDVEPLHIVVEKFKDTKKAVKYLEKYKELMEGFCKSVTIRQCLKESLDVAPTYSILRCETATFVFDWDLDKCNLNEIKDLLFVASDELLKFRYIDTSGHFNYTSITCTFPHSMVNVVYNKLRDNCEILKENRLIELTVGHSPILKRGETVQTITPYTEEAKSHDESTQITEYQYMFESRPASRMGGSSADRFAVPDTKPVPIGTPKDGLIGSREFDPVNPKFNKAKDYSKELPIRSSDVRKVSPKLQGICDDPRIMVNLNIDLKQLTIRPLQVTITAKCIKDIILNSSVQCNLFLAFVGDLPFTRKSNIVPDFLQAILTTFENGPRVFEIENESGAAEQQRSFISQHGSLVLKHEPTNKCLWFAETNHNMQTLSFIGTPMIKYSHLQELPVVWPEDPETNIFPNQQLLNDHMKDLLENTKEMLANKSFDLKWLLSSRAIYVNIFDCSYNKGAIDFLTLITPYIKNNLQFLHMDYDELKEIEKLPQQAKQDVKRKLQLKFIKQFTNVVQLFDDGHNLSESTCTAFAISSKTEDKERARQLLKTIIKEQPAIVIPDKDFTELQREFHKVIESHKRESIKMSWVFLRSTLYFSKAVVMDFDKVENIAKELNIILDELIEFLKTFTKIASLFYLPKISPLQNHVILRPVEFVNKLAFFCEPTLQNSKGIFTKKHVESMCPDFDGTLIMKTLCSLGLAAETNDMRVDRRRSSMKGETMWFIPSSRTGQRSKKTSNLSLFIEFRCKATPPHFEGFFVSEILSISRSVTLVTTEEPNVITFAYKTAEPMFSLIFHGMRIEIIVYNQLGLKDLYEKIVQCCDAVFSKISKLLEGVSYEFALPCIGMEQQAKKEYSRETKLHYLHSHDQKDFCIICGKSKLSMSYTLRNKWKEVVLEFYKRKQDLIDAKDFLDVAMKLSTVIQSPKTLAIQLGLSESREYYRVLSGLSLSQQFLFVLWSWERKVGRENATKQKLLEALHRMGVKYLVSNILK